MIFRLAEKPEYRPITRFFGSNGDGNSQLNFRARCGFAPKIQLGADSLRTFTNPGQPKVSGASTFHQDFWVNAPSIVADPQANQAIIVSNLGLDLTCACVLERISYPLAGKPVDFVLEDRRQGLGLPLYRHTEGRRIAIRILRA